MSIQDYLKRRLNEAIVYWGTPTKDKEGFFTYDDPVEICGRWMQRRKVLSKVEGKEIISQAQIFLLQDVDEEGLLWLGELEDLSSDQQSDPSTLTDAYKIIVFEKKQSIATKGEYGRIAYV